MECMHGRDRRVPKGSTPNEQRTNRRFFAQEIFEQSQKNEEKGEKRQKRNAESECRGEETQWWRGNYWQTPGLLRATVTNLSFTVMSPSTSSFDSADLQLSKLKLLKSE